MLQLKQIVKHYISGNTVVPALKGVDVNFRKSEFVSVLGPSGCGKTTLLNIIGGLDRYTDGDLIINGVSTKSYKDKDWDFYRNHSIGFIFQSYNLISHQSILSNVELALTLSGVSKNERKRRAKEALEKVGLGNVLHKKPNQLSGGQMQRVAIARALVNNPEIILADEPTGALDTVTSVQIMDLLKEISEDKLIIMVTHNPDLADRYSTRIIKLLDGDIISDSNPFSDEDAQKYNEAAAAKNEEEKIVNDAKNDLNADAPVVKKKEAKRVAKNKTAMSFMAAYTLSLKNLLTKKGRTMVTAFAGSIGIIGIALVLSLYNGFNLYIEDMQQNTLSTYPLTISTNSYDLSQVMGTGNIPDYDQYPDGDNIYVNNLLEQLTQVVVSNTITDKYIENAIETIPEDLLIDVTYTKSVNMNIYKQVGDKYKKIERSTNIIPNFNMSKVAVWSQLMNNSEFLSSQYDVLGEGSRLPENKNEIVLVVDSYNRISDFALKALGLYGDTKDYKFSDFIGQEYKIIRNDDYYSFNGSKFVTNTIDGDTISGELYEKGETLTIVGIVRPKEGVMLGSIAGSIGYMPELTDYLIEDAAQSELAEWQRNNPTINALTGEKQPDDEKTMTAALSAIGAVNTPTAINIYPKDFESKDGVKAHLDKYNSEQTEKEDKVYYVDSSEMMMQTMSMIIDVISYVLIAFTAISLVVSSLMIGIIIYISVLERTKEIGIIRSIGGRRRDIARVFNAEAISIGFIAGLIGILLALVVGVIINLVLHSLVGIPNLASLNPFHALILLLLSMFLTFISGLIPSRIAAKKDPVLALRSE